MEGVDGPGRGGADHCGLGVRWRGHRRHHARRREHRGELLRGWQAAKLDSTKRKDDRKIESDRIQRETLLELQPAVTEWMREVTLMHFANVDSLHAGGKRANPLPPGLDERVMLTTRRVSYLSERVTDDDLRESLVDMRTAWLGVVEADAVAGAQGAYDQLSGRVDVTLKTLGPVLRAYL